MNNLNNSGSKVAGDNSQYVRVQQGHSIMLHVFLFWWLTCGISVVCAIYYSLSPNHYWHL